jgi:type III secretory pathway component EscT
MLGAIIAPALVPAPDTSVPLLVTLGSELARGVPVAMSIAICLWGASMTGNLVDELRGGRALSRSPLDTAPTSPLGLLLSLAAALAFLELGGPSRLTEALASARPLGERDLSALARDMAYGLRFAVVLAGPLLALAPFVELLHALMARATHPIGLAVVMTPLKAVTLLAVAALLLDRFASGIVLWMDRAPHVSHSSSARVGAARAEICARVRSRKDRVPSTLRASRALQWLWYATVSAKFSMVTRLESDADS